jgi:hypothetical protein
VGVSIPTSFDVNADVSGSLGATIGGSLGAIGPVTVAGIPNPMHVALDSLPQIDLKLEPVSLEIKPLTLELKPVSLSLAPVDFNIAIKEMPSIRAHLPADFSVGLSLLGMDVLCVRLCGEAQVITEKYVANPCERCGDANRG